MTETTPRAGAPLLAANQAQKNITHNEALYQFDALLCARFLDRDLTAPPSSPTDGDTYLIKATATGAWTGQNGKIAFCADGAWRFYPPFAGLVAYVADETTLLVFNGTSWVNYASLIALENVPMIGVNTTADATNKLAAKSAAILFDNIGNGTQLKLNKNASADTASVLYQTSYSGRAEIGLMGDDNFHFKVSADGATWHDALTIAGSSGALAVSAGQIAFPATQNPSSNANTLDDYEEGTFTPTFTTNGTPPTGVTCSLQQGNYTKVGNVVSFRILVALTSKGTGGTGTGATAGLPFTPTQTAACTGFANQVSFDAGYTMFNGAVQTSGQILLNESGSNASSGGIAWTNYSNSSSWLYTGQYFAS